MVSSSIQCAVQRPHLQGEEVEAVEVRAVGAPVGAAGPALASAPGVQYLMASNWWRQVVAPTDLEAAQGHLTLASQVRRGQ